jgi:hypothetical protein
MLASLTDIEVTAQAWLHLDLPVTISIAPQIAELPFVASFTSLQTPWSLDGTVVGWARSAKSLTQVLVANTGHLVPMNQAAVALDMLDRFLTNRPF